MSKSGNKYILTSVCLASKYPEAIALKKVDAPTVAEALIETFLELVFADRPGFSFHGEVDIAVV